MSLTPVQYRSRDFVHKIVTPRDRIPDATLWCEQQFGPRWAVTGPRSGRWCCFWRGFRSEDGAHYEWLFANESDAIMFTLRWL